MKKKNGIWVVVLSLVLMLGTTVFGADTPVASTAKEHHGQTGHWSYSGETGPDHWSELNPEFAACVKGRYQSPIDITVAEKSDLTPLQFGYATSPLTIVDNGHTVMATYAPGSTLTIGDAKYELQQFHFHHPSEERIHGKQSAMVVHLVHKDALGRLAVVAVLLKRGKANPLVETLWKHLPAEKEKTATFADVPIDAKGLLPSSLGYYTFPGSLTTPPCTEGVTWYVLKMPVEVSSSQLDAFAKLYPMNARPVQPLHDRKVLETKN